MTDQIPGIHHVTAIAGDPQQNVDFYAGLLGLRLVKLTVNFDDPGTHHLYYGDGAGSPGTILTFFPWANAPKGRAGAGQATATAFSIRRGSAAYWQDRLAGRGIALEMARRFDSDVIAFSDPDGLALELVGDENPHETAMWDHSPVPAEHALQGFHGVTLTERQFQQTELLLEQGMGFQRIGEEKGRVRYQASGGGTGSVVDVLRAPDEAPGRVAVGTVHHVAWRTASDETQLEWQRKLAALSFDVSPVMDRIYFHSIYYREPGGVLFEIATDPPGFTFDEPIDQLGSGLKLPPWLEPDRRQIEQTLTPLRLPVAERKVAP